MKVLSFFSSEKLIIVGVVAGIMSGMSTSTVLINGAETAAQLFTNLLKLISLPIIFLSIIATISGMESFDEMKTIGKKVLTYTILTTLVSASLALVIFTFLNPVATSAKPAIPRAAYASGAGYVSFLLKIIPDNIIQTLSDNNNVMGVVFIALLLSIAILTLPRENKAVLTSFFSSLFAAILKITTFIVQLIPIGVWAFVTIFVDQIEHNIAHLRHILVYVGAILSANAIQGIVILPLFLLTKKISPVKTVKGMFKALSLAFFSKSSNATLPVTLKCAHNNLGVSKRVAHFTLPLCSVINMNGCAAFILTTVLFVASHHGMVFSPIELVMWIFVSTLAAIGNAGVPMGCFFLTSALLTSMNVPLTLMGLILPIYTIIDMVETMLNVWSDSCVAVIVDRELR